MQNEKNKHKPKRECVRETERKENDIMNSSAVPRAVSWRHSEEWQRKGVRKREKRTEECHNGHQAVNFQRSTVYMNSSPSREFQNGLNASHF